MKPINVNLFDKMNISNNNTKINIINELENQLQENITNMFKKI